MDAYQQAVEYLTKYPDRIYDAWNHASHDGTKGGCLFRYVSPDGHGGYRYGCLTQIRRSSDIRIAYTDELTEAILKDDRLPNDPSKITVDHLPVFAQWQRYIDKKLGRKPPKIDPNLPMPQVEPEPMSVEELLVSEEKNDE